MNYNLEINFEEDLAKEVIRKTILYYESLVNGIKNLESKMNEIMDFFDERTKLEIDLILNVKDNNANLDKGSCANACQDCLIF